MATETETTAAAKPAKPAKAKPAPKAPKPAPQPKPISQRAQIALDAANGIVPVAPDFSAATHARFRKKHAELVALVEKGDIKALKALVINPVSSSPKAMLRYRDLAVIALEAQRKAAKAAG
jgi:tetrahydromethanopterin S-methyltransferase subunit A